MKDKLAGWLDLRSRLRKTKHLRNSAYRFTRIGRGARETAAILLGLFLVGGGELSAGDFQAPTSSSITCQYDTLSCGLPGSHHTGIDYSSADPIVRAVSYGTVVRIQVNGESCEGQCSSLYSCQNCSNKGLGCGDHGLGNTVVIEHTLTTGGKIYSLYGHLDSFASGLQVGSCVSPGDVIGNMGGTGYGCTQYSGDHLHLEMKEANTLENPTGGGPYYGYTPSSADLYGYVPPTSYFSGSQQAVACNGLLVTGDWNGDGSDSVWTFNEGQWQVPPSDGGASFSYGTSGDLPVVGDWDGDGTDEIGIFRPGESPSRFYLDIDRDYIAEWVIPLAGHYPQDLPVAGDWDNDGDEDIGAWNASNGWFYLFTITSSTTYSDFDSFQMGLTTDIPIAGNWDGTGGGEVGTFRSGEPSLSNNFYFRMADDSRTPLTSLGRPGGWGNVGDVPVIGDWNNDGYDTIGLYRPSTDAYFYDNDLPKLGGGGDAPTVTTTAETGVGQTGATLNGTVNPNGSTTTAYFQYGLTTSYGSTSGSVGMGSGSSASSYGVTIGGFSCNTLYHYRAAANNSSGTSYGGDQTFTTASCAPTPTILVTSPNGFESWYERTYHDITWSSSNLDGNGRIYLYYWYNDDWNYITNVSTSTSSYNWYVPATPTSTASVWIGNWVYEAWEVYDQSDNNFNIEDCTYTLTQTSNTVDEYGGTSGFDVLAPAACTWYVWSDNWIFTYGWDGIGNGTVYYDVDPNNYNSCGRSGEIHVEDQVFTITQSGNGLPPTGPIGSEFQANTYTQYDQRRSSVAVDADGDFVVVWMSVENGVFGQRFSADGSAVGGEFQVNTSTVSNYSWPSAASDAEGAFVVTWDDWPDVFLQRFGSDGAPLGGEFQVNSNPSLRAYTPHVSMNSNGDFVVAWTSYDSYYGDYYITGQRFAADGTPLGSELDVTSVTSSVWNSMPAVAQDADGDFVVVWNSDRLGTDDIFGQRFSSSGAPLGSEFQVNSYTTNDQWNPTVAMADNGDFVIAWDSRFQDGSSSGVFGQQFASDGTPSGEEFQINTDTLGWQAHASISMDADGNFVVVWESDDFPGGGIFGQSFIADGTPVGGEFQVNEHTTHSQWGSSVSMNAGGDFVVSWTSDYQDGCDYGIFGRQFNSAQQSPDELTADFGGNGLWHYDGASWTKPTPWDPLELVAWQDKVATAFGSGRGIWTYGSTGWNQLSAWDPYELVAWGDELVAAFDAGRGLWTYRAGGWVKLTSWEPEQVVAWGDKLGADFGSGRGIWVYESSTWSQISGWDSYDLVAWGDTLVAAFDSGRGVWTYDTVGGWDQTTNWESVQMVVWGDKLAVAFGSGRGIWVYDSSTWNEISDWDSYDLVAWDDKLAGAFDSGRGLWLYDSSTWAKITPWEPVGMEALSGKLSAAFGADRGLHIYDTGWLKISAWSPEDMEGVNIF